ncbi:hypothetical protein FNV43_RR06620 [Rhamnella rubrinervis]|uniref:Uncharacterized protein n=1 Tax=Rhamnella rubrinervis TaxID=2594499 RepID=A0A8K0HDW3_9ROSA|nr:hypothetical protein FNV43_RR06620 [Rhamnella rubrinervis]
MKAEYFNLLEYFSIFRYLIHLYLLVYAEQVRDHLLIHGIVRSCEPLLYHGEMSDTPNFDALIMEHIDDNINEDDILLEMELGTYCKS